jgi:hypothetical protein
MMASEKMINGKNKNNINNNDDGGQLRQCRNCPPHNGRLNIGEVLNYKKDGRGALYFDNGNIYIGEFEDDEFCGYGVY